MSSVWWSFLGLPLKRVYLLNIRIYSFFDSKLLVNLIDAWGRGYKKIFEGFGAAGLPMPVIEEADGGVRVTFQRNIQGNAQATTQKTTLKTTPKTTQKIISAIMENPSISIDELAIACGLTRDGIL